ncbi:MAG: tRNA uridine-5-carboxymethylaminomethyl(34) synthesis enzyme MnmG [Phycisphaerales bacterium]|nr:MAG: tRNA uridine-5-carboxymethylaminomethyl(34) synthesis enzyme MnmG [Phycisphaerales bacterium]
MRKVYDVIVVGGGHAGAEAAWAASRLGATTALVTLKLDAMGRMSCNPAIGGLGKGHMVREIDALGGLMAGIIDATGIQFRMLNKTKGPAVWGPRAQADCGDYAGKLRQSLQEVSNLDLVEGMVEAVRTVPGRDERPQREPESRLTHGGASILKRPSVIGVTLGDGRALDGQAVIVTTGTFLRGLMHCGEVRTEGGRVGEPASNALSAALESLGLELRRLKTGTPPRVHRDSIDYNALTPQLGDDPPVPFSFMTDALDRPQVCCWITYTNERVHGCIRDNLHRAPMYSGQIRSTGPRYCPSIEDKVGRFEDTARHQLFLDPQGRTHDWIYCNGIATSLPRDVQDAVVHGIRGLERARIMQYGYAIEYDFVPTHQIQASLETKCVRGLFLAGQINGTSGYEEAAGQGLIAGVNAVRYLRREEPLVLGRDEAYLGVMIDDLITRPPDEPYRMFTSRGEYRLHLRADNADARLTPIGRRAGLVDDERWRRYQAKQRGIERMRVAVAAVSHGGRLLKDWLRRPDACPAELKRILAAAGQGPFPPEVVEAVVLETKYEGYLARQHRQIDRFRRLEGMEIPTHVDYSQLSELRREAREAFARVAPRTLGQAARISGISPADVTTLWVYLSARNRDRRSVSGENTGCS